MEKDVESARELLADIYDASGGEHWFRNGNWCSQKDVGAWAGVSTDEHGFPLRVNLGVNNLSGELPDLTMKWFVSRGTVFYVDGNPQLAQAEPDEAERAALRALFIETEGRRWFNGAKWNSDEPVSTWHGVSVVNESVHVVWLSRNNLRGVVPNLSPLMFLRELHLQRNNLYGSLGAANLHGCPILSMLRLDFNRYRTSLDLWIPPPMLTRLSLQYNHFYGAPPRQLFELPHLESCELHINKFDEPLPDAVRTAPALRHLSAYGNPATATFRRQALAWGEGAIDARFKLN